MTIKDNDKKMKIIEILKKENRWISTNQIRNLIGLHPYKAEILLNELLSENKVEVDKKDNATYWRLR